MDKDCWTWIERESNSHVSLFGKKDRKKPIFLDHKAYLLHQLLEHGSPSTHDAVFHSDWLASSFAQAFGSPLVVLHFVILRFSLRFSDSRDPTLISDFNVSSRFWAAHLVSSAITAGSPCGCSAAYSPSAYLTLPKHLSLFYFIFLSCIFLSIHRSASCR